MPVATMVAVCLCATASASWDGHKKQHQVVLQNGVTLKVQALLDDGGHVNKKKQNSSTFPSVTERKKENNIINHDHQSNQR